MKRKLMIIALVLIIVLTMGLLAGCNGNDGNPFPEGEISPTDSRLPEIFRNLPADADAAYAVLNADEDWVDVERHIGQNILFDSGDFEWCSEKNGLFNEYGYEWRADAETFEEYILDSEGERHEVISSFAEIFAMRASHTEEEAENLEAGTAVWMETLGMLFFKSEAEAEAAYVRIRDNMAEVLEYMKKALEEDGFLEDITLSFSIHRSGNVVAVWVRIAGIVAEGFNQGGPSEGCECSQNKCCDCVDDCVEEYEHELCFCEYCEQFIFDY